MTIKKIFFYSIFFLIFILYLPFIINSFYGPIYPYAFSDLHINYSGGFIRRGLLGEIARIFYLVINQDLLSHFLEISLYLMEYENYHQKLFLRLVNNNNCMDFQKLWFC